MDYIYEFIEQCEKDNVIPSLSEFITKFKVSVVTNVEYSEKVVTWKTIRQYWTNAFSEALECKNIKGSNDRWIIDWDELAKSINDKKRKRKMEEAAEVLASEFTNQVTKRTKISCEDDNENPFLDKDETAVDYLSILNNMKEYRNSPNIPKNDLIAHGILDLVSKDEHTFTRECLGSLFNRLYSNSKVLNKQNYRMKYLDADPQTVRSYTNALIKDKLMKVYSKQLKNEKNYLERDQTEFNYIMSFWYPLFHRLLRDDSRYEIMWGEGSLRAAKGPSTDGVIIHESSGLEIAIIEVSGPPQNGQHADFVGDRNKIAINLKRTMKKIIAKTPSANKAVLSNIVLLGIQMYKHHLYLYSLTMPAFDLYVFTEVQKIQLPVKIYDAHKNLPSMISALWMVKISLDRIVKLLDEANNDYDSDDDATINDFAFDNTLPRL
ncbi:hypothetical protein INT45_009275 [Circinella minor]|uniref:Uncharacterized protein n=1 Tax=Circinella minor TaxID=1195481 RepID=A0A8H7S3T9_9FUNG|nr:hypothetical protein INT45_009275 [Circinella minor]